MLKVKFWRIENVVLMRVLEQGAEIERGCGKFFCASGIKLGSYTKPLIISNKILLKGESLENDRDIACQQFKSVDSAKEFINDATKAVHAYNQSLIKESEQISDDIETMIVE